MKRPSIKSPCVADNYAGVGERIAEVMFPDGTSCLIYLRALMGVNRIEIGRVTGRVAVQAGDHEEVDIEGDDHDER